jgi:hypothetical protein
MGAIEKGVSAKLKQRKTPSEINMKQGKNSLNQKTLQYYYSTNYGLYLCRKSDKNQAKKPCISTKSPINTKKDTIMIAGYYPRNFTKYQLL